MFKRYYGPDARPWWETRIGALRIGLEPSALRLYWRDALRWEIRALALYPPQP